MSLQIKNNSFLTPGYNLLNYQDWNQINHKNCYLLEKFKRFKRCQCINCACNCPCTGLIQKFLEKYDLGNK